ncbi:hypothetical protein FIBSPDRAFT_1039652 [Athelia psychrophila]|uniref:RING-type domain-containing protein n=1 Tax=Athelia psychrophila TaxID=1759441 RepID=A0A166RR52_9AGAM|nr:hypothetical protein FIBSPDRAFT_1039652 [Fibularhizoctonia sp. CBS 109695]
MVYLDLDANVDLIRTELLEVSKSCYAPVLKKVATLFTHLKLVEPGVTLTATQHAIPLSLSPAQFFRILPHLVVPGTIYPFRAAAMTAIISLITAVPFLRERATEFLIPLKGTWLNLEVPENVSYDCARFLLSAPQGTVLDEQEKEVYKAMRRYRLIELNSESVVSAQVPWTPHKTTEVGDRKVKCEKCNIARSVTLMSGEQPGVCGLCVVYEFAQNVPTDYPEKGEMPRCQARGSSAQPLIVTPNTSLKIPAFSIVQWLGLDPAADLFTGKSAFKIIQAHDFSVFDARASDEALRTLMLGGKKDRDPERLQSLFLCFEEMPRGKLVPACGRSGCKQRVDEGCLLEWYGKSEPGRLLNLMQLTCPFCRRKPAVKTLARHNPRAATLGGLEPALADHGWFYAWCISCGFAKRAHERVCCEGDRVPPVHQFRCSDCAGVPAVDGIGRLTACPQCGVLVEKSHGCNHIECPCGQHFCHVCGRGTAESEIYDHMAREHGGIFDEGADMDGEDDFDDYDSDY